MDDEGQNQKEIPLNGLVLILDCESERSKSLYTVSPTEDPPGLELTTG